MTRFHFNTFNHCDDGRRCLEDVTAILSHQLRALGHEATATDDGAFLSAGAGYNVLYESFADPGTIPTIAAAHAAGCRFLYVATEEPTEAGCFNGRLDNAMDARQAAFPEAVRYADGILHLVPGDRVTAWYARFAPAAYVELGYAPTLVHRAADNAEPEYAFGFYGQLTPRRQKIFDRLCELSGEGVLVLPFITHGSAMRDASMRNVKVIPQVRAHDSMELVSSSRCATALHLGRPVVAEPHAIDRPWAEVVAFAASLDEFYDLAIAATHRWREWREEQLARFAARLPPEVCLAPALRALGL